MVPRKTRIQEPVVTEHHNHHDHHVDSTVVHPIQGHEINEGDVEVTDEELSHRIRQNRERTSRIHEENRRLEKELASLRHSVSGGNLHKLNSIVKHNAELKAHTSELTSRLDVCTQHNTKLRELAAENCKTHLVDVHVASPEVRNLTHELESLLEENRKLVAQARSYQ